MNRVSVIGTVHDEKGLASVANLCAILNYLRPEVIFLELPSSAYADYFENFSRANLESRAIVACPELHPVRLVLVDPPTPAEEFFENGQKLFASIEAESREYRRLIDRNSAMVSDKGFDYLNSEPCGDLWSDVNSEVLSSLRRMNDSELVEQYDRWRSLMDLRETEMLETIRSYCRDYAFVKGVFLVGAAHRRPIMDKTRTQTAIEAGPIEWDFVGH